MLSVAVHGRPVNGSVSFSVPEHAQTGPLAAWVAGLPGTVEACPRKAFEQRRFMPAAAALRLDEIAPDPRGWTRSVRIDIDEPDASTRWLDAGLPQPNFIVINKKNGHAHYIYNLGVWVRDDKPGSVRYLQRVRRAYAIAVDGDLGYNGHMHHNPLSPAYTTIVGPETAWSLGDLAQYVELFRPTYALRGSAKIDENNAALGPNCNTFEQTRVRAYRDVARFRKTGDQAGFADCVLQRATVAAQEYESAGGRHVRDRHVRSVAKSVASWVWTVYGQGPEAAHTRKARYAKTREVYITEIAARRSQALKLRASGASLSNIAVELGISRRTVCNYLSTSNLLVQSPHLSEIAREGAAPESVPTSGSILAFPFGTPTQLPDRRARKGAAPFFVLSLADFPGSPGEAVSPPRGRAPRAPHAIPGIGAGGNARAP